MGAAGNQERSAMSQIVVIHDNLKFGFDRDQAGLGYWYCMTNRRTQYGFGSGCVVPRKLWDSIRESAINQGVDPSSISYARANTVSSAASSTNRVSKNRTTKGPGKAGKTSSSRNSNSVFLIFS